MARSHPDAIEKETREKYDGGIYKGEAICAVPKLGARHFADILLEIKFSLVMEHIKDGCSLDLCCGSGLHLLALSDRIKHGVGVDFSKSFIQRANQERKALNIENIEFVQSNARLMPFKEESFGHVYSFSSLYHIPSVGEVINEISRVLKRGGTCIIELGNLYSLNTLVCKAHPELAYPCHIPVKRMKEAILKAELKIIRHRAFQFLPLWANKPLWLYPVISPFWNKVMEKKIKGRMIDEYLSNLPLIRFLAFRHIFVCTK